MGRRSPAVPAMVAVVALFLLPAISNIEANALPTSWAPYLWVAWPAGVVLAAPLVYLDVRERQRERHRAQEEDGAASAERQLDRAADVLAASVRRQWAAEKRLRLLDHPVPLRLRWASTVRPVAAPLIDVVTPDSLPARPRAVRGDDAAQMAALLSAVRGRQLVVLGAPGAGKSALSLLFVLYQLGHRRPGDPVAVLLTVSSWDPRIEHLHTWLARRIAEEYPALGDMREYGASAPAALVAEGRVMAVLDGLDEMPASMRPTAIAALDRAAAPELPMVVTCRSAEYEAAVTGSDAFLSRAAVLEIQPLDLTAVGRFLTATRPADDQRWRPVVQELHAHPDAPLARVLASPLMVSLARTVYGAPGSAPDELLDHARFADSGAMERHLLGAFVSAVYHQAPTDPASPPMPGRSAYPPLQARQRLVFLARHLARLDTGDLAWWRLADTMPRAALALGTALPVGLLFGLSGELAGGARIALILAVAFGAAAGLSSAFAHPPVPARVQLRLHASALLFLAALVAGCAVGVGTALALRHFAAAALAAAGLTFGIAFVSRVWMDVPTDPAEAPSARITLTQNRTAALAFALAVAVASGFLNGVGYTFNRGISLSAAGLAGVLIGSAAAGGFAGYFAYGRMGGIAFALAGAVLAASTFISVRSPAMNSGLTGLEYGIVFGLATATTGVLSRAWGRFAVARIWLAISGRLPWRIMRFLDDAHRRGVLRQSGAVYEFRHVRLRDHLAHTDPE